MISILSNVYYRGNFISECQLYPCDEPCSDVQISYSPTSLVTYSCEPLRRFEFNYLQLSYVFREICYSRFYRSCFLKKRIYSKKLKNAIVNAFKSASEVVIVANFQVQSFDFFPIDRAGNYLVLEGVYVKIKLDEGLSILSTLGGAFSALGESHVFYAIRAGQTSIKQLRLACATGDPSLIARCSIYLVYSLCQRGLRKSARKLLCNFIHPYITSMITTKKCDNVLRNMYKAACFRVKYYYTIDK